MPRTAITTPQVVSRFMGGSTLFNGSTSVVSIGAVDLLLGNTVTISAWVYKTTSAAVTIYGCNNATNELMFDITSLNQVRAIVNGVIYAATDANAVNLNKWEHVLFTRNGSISQEIYVNGVSKGLINNRLDLSFSSTNSVKEIGRRAAASNVMLGKIAEVKIWKDVYLSASQALFESKQYSCGVLPTYFWKLDDLPPTYIESIAGNNGTGTATTYSPDTPIQQRVVVSDDKASLKFDGVDDYVNIPFTSSLTFDNIDPFTAQVVLKNTKLGLVQRILAQGLEILMRTTASNTYEAVFNSFSTNDRTSGGVVNLNKWDDVVMQFDGTKIKLFQDGKKVSEITPTGTYGGDTNAFAIGISAGEVLSSFVKSTRIWNTALTHQQIRDLHFNKIVPTTGLVGEWLLNEGAGTIAYDTSGNGNNGTISGATWSADTPSKARELVGGNLVPNGFLTNVPPFVAETTNSGGVIVGQAAVASHGVYGVSKSEQSKIFRWSNDAYNVTNPKFRYVEGAFLDGSNAIKMSFTDVKERVNLRLAQRNYPDLNNPDDIRLNCVPVLPNTSYTFSVKGKLVVSSKTGNPFGIGGGFYMYAYEHTPSVAITMRKVNFLESDTNEIKRSITFTTGANTRFINIGGGAYGNATDYWSGEVYVGNIYLNKTIPDTRTAV